MFNVRPDSIQQINILKSLLGNDPNALFQQMMNSNPQFKKFVEDNKGKTVQQICSENGLNEALINSLLK